MVVNADSQEALGEAPWMACFGQLDGPLRSAVLDAETDCPEFERFFRDHLRKLLWVLRRPRYLSKANYNVTRMAYLLKLFPDARFVLPLRDPARAEGRRVGKECVSTCRVRGGASH